MNIGKKTIIMFCLHRSGSTAVYNVFRKHSMIRGRIEKNRNVFFEPNYWNTAARALEGKVAPFKRQVSAKFPYVAIPDDITKDVIFKIWDMILEKENSVIFDKTPFYLGDRTAVNLILEYKKRGNDVRIFFLIRNPLDTIASQHELRRLPNRGYGLQEREIIYIERIKHIDEINKEGYYPIFKYENIVMNPNKFFGQMFDYCGIALEKRTWAHISSISIGRYWWSINGDVRKWQISKEMFEIMKKYGYLYKKPLFIKRFFMITIMFPKNFQRELSRWNRYIAKRSMS